MSKLKRLVENYGNYIATPWSEAAAAQRVIFCVYNENDELQLRVSGEVQADAKPKAMIVIILTSPIPLLIGWRVKNMPELFSKPQLINTLLPKYAEYIAAQFKSISSKREELITAQLLPCRVWAVYLAFKRLKTSSIN